MKDQVGSTHFLSFSHKLLLLVIAIFLTLGTSFVVYQYQREKDYKIQLLNTQLQDLNTDIFFDIPSLNDSLSIARHLHNQPVKDVRITVITTSGDVIYDSTNPKGQNLFENHLMRPEVQKALLNGNGYDVRRISETTGIPYFYSATLFQNVIIRSAAPYDIDLLNHLKADFHYLWFTLVISLILLFVFYKYTQKLGASITRLREFAMRADKNEPIDPMLGYNFPHNELGEISQHIIQIYKRLHKTKEALYIEREKLITHLQISHEGLGVFTKNKKEILVNNLFTQYMNLISDSNLETAEAAFEVRELQEITDFINRSPQRGDSRNERRMSIVIRKNGRTFIVECILFQDESFEITINDTTQEEEQSRLKRQLTQNIAHELKTPVSSIQGYLETIINTPQLSRDKEIMFLDRCYAQSNRLSRLLRDISVLTRMDEASNLIEMERVDISLLVANIFNEVALELEEKNITVINSLQPGIRLQGNHSLIYSIFRNLTDNAIAYAGSNIEIRVQCFREDDDFYYFSFSDTGVGVAPEHLNRLFERFYRVDKGRSRKLGGTGLGLAIVKNAVILHHGSISAKQTPGGGLEFVFTLGKR